MNVFIQSPDAGGYIDGAVQSMVLRHFPNQVRRIEYCDVVIVPFTRHAGYKFNQAMNATLRPWVMLDYSEVEWNFFERQTDSFILGHPERGFDRLKHQLGGWYLEENYRVLDDWTKLNPPALYFKRELHKDGLSDKIRPIEWPCYLDIPKIQSESEFNARPIEVTHWWGHSHPSRVRLHAEIFKAMETHGIDVVSSVTQAELNPQLGQNKVWASIYAPYYSRTAIGNIGWLQRHSKLVVSLPGAGIKCFRHAEAPVGSVMALLDDNLAWSYPWEDGKNCVRLGKWDQPSLFEALNTGIFSRGLDLYPIYLDSQATIEKYQSHNYIHNYVLPLIAAAI